MQIIFLYHVHRIHDHLNDLCLRTQDHIIQDASKFSESHRKCWCNWFTEGYNLDSCPRFITNHHNLWLVCGFSSENRHFCSGLKLPSVRKGCPRSSGWLSNAMKRQMTLGHLEIWNNAAAGQDALRWGKPMEKPKWLIIFPQICHRSYRHFQTRLQKGESIQCWYCWFFRNGNQYTVDTITGVGINWESSGCISKRWLVIPLFPQGPIGFRLPLIDWVFGLNLSHDLRNCPRFSQAKFHHWQKPGGKKCVVSRWAIWLRILQHM